MYCSNCGCKVHEDEKVCSDCGASLYSVEYCGGFWGLVGKRNQDTEYSKNQLLFSNKEESSEDELVLKEQVIQQSKSGRVKENFDTDQTKSTEKQPLFPRDTLFTKLILIGAILFMIISIVQSARLLYMKRLCDKYESKYKVLSEANEELTVKYEEVCKQYEAAYGKEENSMQASELQENGSEESSAQIESDEESLENPDN